MKDAEESTISDWEGNFQINTSGNNQILIISASGYESKTVKLSELPDHHMIEMTPMEKVLEEVRLTSKDQYKSKIIGKENIPMITFSHMFTDKNPAGEQGSIFTVPGNVLLKDFNFRILPSSKFKSVRLKLNIYSVNHEIPDKQLLSQNIIFEAQNTGWYHLDLESYHIHIKGHQQLALTCQLLEKQDMENVPFSFGLSAYSSGSRNIVSRNGVQSEWKKESGTFLANIHVGYKKDLSTEATQHVTEEIPAESDIKLLDFAQIEKYKEEAKGTIYGKNNEKGNFVTLKDANIYYEIYGTGEPLVLLQGNGGEICDFYKQIPEFSKKYKVIAIDTRGQGKSSDSSHGDLKYEMFADDLKEVLEKLNVKKINILGWSDGGITALIMAYKYPDMVKIIITMGANLHPDGVDESLLISFKKQLEEDRSNAVKDSPQHIRFIKLMVNEPNITKEDLQKIKCPALIIAGERDVIKREHTKEIANNISGSKMNIISNASHFALQEKPEIFNQIVFEFLNYQK